MSGTDIPVGFRFKEKNSSKIGNRDGDGRFFSDRGRYREPFPKDKISVAIPKLNKY
jgi:hypothetical protein